MTILSACTPREQAVTPPLAPPKITAQAFIPSVDVVLPLRHWKAKQRPPRAIIIALHGFNDYSHAFEGAARYFALRGIDTYAYDQRGFGASPQRGIWGSEANLVSDAQQMLAVVRAKHPGVPVFLLGESMGSAVAVEALAGDDVPSAAGVILSSPALWGGEYFSVFLRTSLWMGAHLFPAHELTGEGLHVQASDNIPMLRALGRDPLILKKSRIDAVYGLACLMDHAYNDAAKLDVPVLILYGDHDQIIPAGPVHEFSRHLQTPYRFIEYDEGWHLLLRDLRAAQVWGDIARWVLARGPARP